MAFALFEGTPRVLSALSEAVGGSCPLTEIIESGRPIASLGNIVASSDVFLLTDASSSPLSLIRFSPPSSPELPPFDDATSTESSLDDGSDDDLTTGDELERATEDFSLLVLPLLICNGGPSKFERAKGSSAGVTVSVVRRSGPAVVEDEDESGGAESVCRKELGAAEANLE